MEEKLKQVDEIFNAIDESLIKEVLEKRIAKTVKEHCETLTQAGIKGDDLVVALTSVSVVESVRLSAFIAALLVTVNLNEPLDPRDFIHLVK